VKENHQRFFALLRAGQACGIALLPKKLDLNQNGTLSQLPRSFVSPQDADCALP
jgi:hypothetical protein